MDQSTESLRILEIHEQKRLHCRNSNTMNKTITTVT